MKLMCVNTDTTNWFTYFKLMVGISKLGRPKELALKVSKLSYKHNDNYFENLWNTVSRFKKTPYLFKFVCSGQL